MKFKETKSQERLINLMLQAGVEWPGGANFAAQDKSGSIFGYHCKPVRFVSEWSGENVGFIHACHRIINWNQTIITREMWEARDGWITWYGGECPVDGGVKVDVQFRCNDENLDGFLARSWSWEQDGHYAIAAYRIHKPAEQAESDGQSKPCEPVEVGSKCISKLHVDVVAASVINDIEKKTAEAEKHKAELERCQGELAEMRKALDDMLAVVGLKAVEVEKESEQPTITDWRDLRIGDVVELVYCSDNDSYLDHKGDEMVVVTLSENIHGIMLSGKNGKWWLCDNTDWGFIRRPSTN